jgi:TP901 family phage tail tape measure protein
MKFQSQMLLLNTQAGVSMPNVKKMSQGVLEISTQTGQSLSNVSESAYHVASNMASMGSTVPNMLNAVKVAAQGATVGHANMVDVTNALTAAIASGIPGVKNYQQAMGVLNSTVGSGDMTMQDLADAFGTGMVASVKGYGLSIQDVGAALATFGDNNIRGAKAGTDLRMAVQALAVPVSTAAPELAKLGLTTNSLAKDMQSGGLLKALDDLQSKFTKNGITAKNEGQVITDLFGKKAGVGLSLLMERVRSMSW